MSFPLWVPTWAKKFGIGPFAFWFYLIGCAALVALLLLTGCASPVMAQSLVPDYDGGPFTPHYDSHGNRTGMFDNITAGPPPPPVLALPSKASAGIIDYLSGHGPAYKSFNEGIDYLNAGKNREGIESLGKAVSNYPAWPEAQYALAIAMGRARLLDDAKHHFEEALRLRPGYVDASRGLTLATALIEQRQASQFSR